MIEYKALSRVSEEICTSSDDSMFEDHEMGEQSSLVNETDDIEEKLPRQLPPSRARRLVVSIINTIRDSRPYLYYKALFHPYLGPIFLALLPSYVRRRVLGQPRKQEKLHTVATLDGLRGLACLFVFNHHFTNSFTPRHLNGFGVDNNTYIPQVPFIRVLWAGIPMVSVFFIVSGYVLSYKPIKQMHQRSHMIQKTLTSSIFRRGMRLYLPTITATFICVLLLRLRAFEYSRHLYDEVSDMIYSNEPLPRRFDTFEEQFWDWWGTVSDMTSPWGWGTTMREYDRHLWTIPTEFRASMLLFLTQVGFSRLRAPLRMFLVACMIWYCMKSGQPHVLLFYVGMFLVETDLLLISFRERHSNNPRAIQLPLHRPDDSLTLRARSGLVYTISSIFHAVRRVYTWIMTPECIPFRICQMLIFLAGLYLVSTPCIDAERTPGYIWLVTKFYPSYYGDSGGYFWQCFGSMLLVISAVNGPDTKILYTNRFSQYLGKISYALYIVHGNVLRSVLYSCMPSIWAITAPLGGRSTVLGFTLSWLLGFLITWPIVFWLSDLFWRGIDENFVRLARKLEEWAENPGWVATERRRQRQDEEEEQRIAATMAVDMAMEMEMQSELDPVIALDEESDAAVLVEQNAAGSSRLENGAS